MKPFTTQELEACGFFSKMFGSKPTENGWKELNNLLAEATDMNGVSADAVKGALKKWGVKFTEENLNERSSIYRKLGDVVYTEAMSEDDALFVQLEKLGQLLELPPHLIKLADKGSKTAAYFIRCRKLLNGEEKLNINQINKLFGYDYEDGLSIRKQVFIAYFNLKFDEISKAQRFTPEQEEGFRADCAKLDIPYEHKNNIKNALSKYRDLWNAEHMPLGNIPVNIPLNPGEICRAYANSGLCEHKVVETEDNYFELTRKFRIDETVSFKGEKLEHPKIKEEITALTELGYFFLTNQRIIFLSQKNALTVSMKDLAGADFDGVNMVTFNGKKGEKYLYKFSDEAAGVMCILFNRVLKEDQH